MPEGRVVLLDQNVPRAVAAWLRALRPNWTVHHVAELDMATRTDGEIFTWAQAHAAMIVTFDEDFADRRSFAVGAHAGVVRLRVWPTTIEETQRALARLVDAVSEEELFGALVIVDRTRIRLRRS